jgi:N-acetylmannosamine-6-phosphate 2-epimerase/N-acetylmannosamine kinase
MDALPILAIDLGGTKTLAGLVAGAEVVDSLRMETPRAASTESWMETIADLVSSWYGRYSMAGIAVTGGIADGRWWALNPQTLPVPAGFPLVERLSATLGVEVVAANDAQAAAWGEYRHGAGQGRDMVFLTISTGIGGGLVLGGALRCGRDGLAGHVGIAEVETRDGPRMLEAVGSGAALARLAAEGGHPLKPPSIIAAAERGEMWAAVLVDRVVAPVARMIAGLQLILGPDLFVIGGGMGLSGFYRDRLQTAVEELAKEFRPTIVAAALGANAGIIGIADLVRTTQRAREGSR